VSSVSASCWFGGIGFVVDVVLGGFVVGGDVVGTPVVGAAVGGGSVGTVMIVGGVVEGTVGGSVIRVVVVLVLGMVVVDEEDVVDELEVVDRLTSIALVSSPPPLVSAIASPMIASPPTAAPPTIIAARCCRWRSLIGVPTPRTYPQECANARRVRCRRRAGKPGRRPRWSRDRRRR
jgi:hypothetical protein